MEHRNSQLPHLIETLNGNTIDVTETSKELNIVMHDFCGNKDLVRGLCTYKVGLVKLIKNIRTNPISRGYSWENVMSYEQAMRNIVLNRDATKCVMNSLEKLYLGNQRLN